MGKWVIIRTIHGRRENGNKDKGTRKKVMKILRLSWRCSNLSTTVGTCLIVQVDSSPGVFPLSRSYKRT